MARSSGESRKNSLFYGEMKVPILLISPVLRKRPEKVRFIIKNKKDAVNNSFIVLQNLQTRAFFDVFSKYLPLFRGL